MDEAAKLSDLPTYFGNVLMYMIPLIGIICFCMVLAGGFKILTSGSDAKGLESGKSTITWAVAGVALSIVSWLILVTLENITGVKITQFKFSF